MHKASSHLTIPTTLVSSVHWGVSIDGDSLSNRSLNAPDWNRNLDIEIFCEITMVLSEVLTSVALDPASHLVLVISASSSVPGVYASSTDIRNKTTRGSLVVSGSTIGGSLRLTATIAVLKGESSSPLAATAPGSVLYRATRDLILEGDAPRLPLLPTSFTDQGIANSEGALWWLKFLDNDLQIPSNDCLWLWVNTDSPVMRDILSRPDDPSSTIWAQVLQWDFTRQLLSFAIAHEDLDMQESYPQDSLGSTLSGVVRLLSDDLRELRSEYASDQGFVEARLQAELLKETE